MIIDSIVESPQKLWREQAERGLHSPNPSPPPIASFSQSPDDRQPDRPSAAPAPWPRVFPGL
jgi:hypothetical protein